MSWSNLFGKKKEKIPNLTVFVLSAELSFRTTVQVAYKTENDKLKVWRFFSNNWSKEVSFDINNTLALECKAFVYCANLAKPETLKLSIASHGKMIISKNFIIPVGNTYAGWFELNLSV